ncbi:HELB helicase, partial [Amia calva]|nr:HELB helicase [Amia calva]
MCCPFYKLRTDLGENPRSVIALFLKACGVSPDHVTTFSEWLQVGMKLDFSNLQEKLEEFGEEGSDSKAIAGSITKSVNKSDVGKTVQVASGHPLVMKYLPVLLPRKFRNLLMKWDAVQEKGMEAQMVAHPEDEVPPDTLLNRLEKLIRTDVWKLGFTKILRKEFGIIHCEATLEAFRQCDLLRQIPELQRKALLVYDTLKRICRSNGCTYVTKYQLDSHLKKKCSWRMSQPLDFLKEQNVVVVLQDEKVFLRNFYDYETGIAKSVGTLLRDTPWHIDLDVRKVLRAAHCRRMEDGQNGSNDEAQVESRAEDAALEADTGPAQSEHGLPNGHQQHNRGTEPGEGHENVELDPDQVRAAEMICANPVTVISGKGGCGKTTVVTLVFRAVLDEQEEVRNACKAFENDLDTSKEWNTLSGFPSDTQQQSVSSSEPIKVLLTAPTGRAASLLKKRTSFDAFTLHQVLFSYMKARKGEFGIPHDWKFADVQVFVVDEGSLVSVQILNSVLNLLVKYAQLKKLILLGDVRQLPSIEPGNTLADMFNGLLDVSWAIEMKTNHRAESQLIVNNAGQISDMGTRHIYYPLEYDATVALGGKAMSVTMPTTDKSFIFVRLPPKKNGFDLQDAIKLLLNSAPGLEDHGSSQFVAFRRKDCELINELCCQHYSNHTTRNHKRKLAFQPGDKVCCTKNGYVTECTLEKDLNQVSDIVPIKMERLCNGEIFFITNDEEKDKKRYLNLDDREGRELCVWFRELQRECSLKHAWARTIHTFQGSEAETVVYVLGAGGGESWQHVYTAVTRGRKRVYVVGEEKDFQRAMQWKLPKRNTQLRELLKQELYRGRSERAGEPASQANGTENPPSAPFRAASGLWPTQYTPLPTQSKESLKLHLPTSLSCQRSLWDSGSVDESLSDDVAFSQTYTWSPMDGTSSAVPSQHHAGKDQMDGLDASPQPGCPHHVDTPGNPSGAEWTPSASPARSKRQNSTDNDCGTPSKLHRVRV